MILSVILSVIAVICTNSYVWSDSSSKSGSPRLIFKLWRRKKYANLKKLSTKPILWEFSTKNITLAIPVKIVYTATSPLNCKAILIIPSVTFVSCWFSLLSFLNNLWNNGSYIFRIICLRFLWNPQLGQQNYIFFFLI